MSYFCLGFTRCLAFKHLDFCLLTHKVGNKAISSLFGEVLLDKKGADDSLAHGMGRLKAIAYAAVKDVIERGILVHFDFNHKNRGYNSGIVVAPIRISNIDYICSVVIKINRENARFYLYEAIEKEKAFKRRF